MRALDRGEVIPAKISQSPSETSSLASAPTSVGDALVGRPVAIKGAARRRGAAGRTAPLAQGPAGVRHILAALMDHTRAHLATELAPGRVAGAHCCAPAPSEPCMPVTRAHGSSKPVRVRRLAVIRPAVRRPSVRSPPKRRPTCPRVLTPHRRLHLAHLTLSASFRVQAPARIRPVIQDRAGGGRRHANPRFAVAFRRTGIRFWVILSR
jgi:hypothetical protein